MVKISVPTIVRGLDSYCGLRGFVERLREGCLNEIWDAAGLFEFYADDFAEHASGSQRPLSKNQFFRQIGVAGIRRFRAGAKDRRGKRPYLYRLTAPARPRRRRGRSVDVRLRDVVA